MSSSTWFHKPENALKRSSELIAVGNRNAALEMLHSVFSNRKYKQWQPAYETLMIRYLDLCIELKKHREAKDGLHQYRNMTQLQMPSSLEIIVNHLLKESELRAVKAKAEANAMSTAVEGGVLLVGDLEAESTPEGIMLSTMTDASGRERTDREVVIPWLKFLWEAYRAVLDILKTNSKLENTYHNTCITAFNFCKVYGRTLEFKRLCETLRQHIQSLQKHSQKHGSVPSNRLRCWEGFTNECIELHLQTRFAQLEVAASLELWTEGFRTVEDIYTIMQIGRRVPKARLMASYYEKLTRIFFVSNNHLFHAYAWYKYYTLSREFNKALTADECQTLACCVLLATLSIPEMSSGSSSEQGVEAMLNEDDLTKEKNERMSTLLGFNTDTSRKNLLKELIAKGILNAVHPQLRFLYTKLETNSPLTLVESLKPAFDYIGLPENSATLGIYRPRLEKVIVLSVLKGLSERYSTVSLSNFRKYLSGLEMPYDAIEQTLVRAMKNQELVVRIDHRSRALRFGSAQLDTNGVRGQLTSLARQLARIASITSMAVSPLAHRTGKAKSDADRASLFKVVASRLDRHQEDALKRKDMIEKRKENAERLEQERQRKEANKKAVEERARKEEEVQRLAQEARVREREQKQKLEDDYALEQTKQVLGHYGKKVDNLEQMDRAEREQVIQNVKDEALTEKEKEEKRRRDQARRLDYIVRALRLEEGPILEKKFAQQQNANADEYARCNAEHIVQHRKDWEKDTKDKIAMAAILSHCRVFEGKVLASHKVRERERIVRSTTRSSVHKVYRYINADL